MLRRSKESSCEDSLLLGAGIPSFFTNAFFWGEFREDEGSFRDLKRFYK